MTAKRFFSVLCVLLSIQLSYAQYSSSKLKTLDSTLTILHQRASFNGAVLVAENGKIVYKKALGIANLATQAPLKTTSSFNLASISKQFMAMMVMMLKEQGKLQFDDKVQKHLPDFPYEKISIRHLLTHTSGLPEYFELAQKHNNTLDTLTNEKLLQLLKTHQPYVEFGVGEKWEYNNTGYVILVSVIEKAAGMPIEDFFKQQITRPLDMNDTYIYCLRMKQSPINRVMGYQRKNGRNVPNDLIRLDGVVGDGNVYSSVEDLLKWEQALYTQKLVSTATWQEAITPVKLNNGTTYPYGFGWKIEEEGKVLSHTGGWVGFLNVIVRNVEKKQTIIVLTNSTDVTATRIVRDILVGKVPKLPQTQLISNIKLIDGTGTASRKTAVRLRDDRIWEIGDLTPFPNEAVTDGKGMTLAPGFIDSHSHHFGGLEQHPDAIAALNQGVTTIVTGQDGGSTPMDTLQSFFKKRPVAINVATYTGHSTLRAKVMGAKSLYRTAKPEEVEKMKILLRDEMKKGSLGLATGLEYESAFFSNRDEVLTLAKVAAESGGRYMSHIRSEDINLDEAVDEIIEIGKQTKMPVQISHIKIAKRDQWGNASALLTKLQKARAQGVNITADCYPYDFWNSTLRVLFPNRDYTNSASAEFAVTQLCDPEKSVVVRFAPNKDYAGKTLSQIAAIRQEKPAQTLMVLIAQAAEFEEKNPDYEGGIEAIMGKSMDEPDITSFLSWSHTNICSDGAWRGHPRGYGAFTRVLGTYVRDKKIMPLETAIHKMTGLTAEHLGITDRGIVQSGYYADLVLLNPETVKDNASIQNSTALSSGIEKVWVNGQLVYESQKSTGKFPGVFIKRK
ncbi:serine hydrolase [Runella salmonicolor]|uniref:Serine hydrolase n=1 Tax=Runella salmonicolor TaxID=2950278 RepID=A0ABT1FU32_9BACT|nr:serine hydrolase [Runella salmonicolor]MCP1385270.1 serine hydrolase [Runella salmonicolor]